MDDLKKGDLVRRRSDDLLMEIDSIEQDIACCHVVEPFMPPRKIFICRDDVVLEHKAESFSRGLDK
ncbi:hypothetical protein VO70_02625 [Aeromonas salmonicida]|nr:hypothetical protein VO70_02625 [Aeromonas salmonicida]